MTTTCLIGVVVATSRPSLPSDAAAPVVATGPAKVAAQTARAVAVVKAPHAPSRARLPLLPSGPGGVRQDAAAWGVGASLGDPLTSYESSQLGCGPGDGASRPSEF